MRDFTAILGSFAQNGNRGQKFPKTIIEMNGASYTVILQIAFTFIWQNTLWPRPRLKRSRTMSGRILMIPRKGRDWKKRSRGSMKTPTMPSYSGGSDLKEICLTCPVGYADIRIFIWIY